MKRLLVLCSCLLIGAAIDGFCASSARAQFLPPPTLNLAMAECRFNVPSVSNSNFTISPSQDTSISYDGTTRDYYWMVMATSYNTVVSWNSTFTIVATNNSTTTSAPVILSTSFVADGTISNAPLHAGSDSEISFLSGSASGDCASPTQFGYRDTGSGNQSSIYIDPLQAANFEGSWDGAAGAYNY